ncbi:hypothetical protein [Mucilaginibacter sp. 22184]|uniref:hypothetical protein n=1 Tax=Mucilaginibacter sp. 22184 TaxID=3453887 RepID=UPI003F860B0F
MERLRISPEIQAFFHIADFRFDYGTETEIFQEGLHLVPTTTNAWLAGNQYAPEVIITHSAMEAIAWYVHHSHRYRDPYNLAFVSLGNLPCEEQISWLRRNFARRKFTLVFGNQLLGGLTDIWVASALKGKPALLRWQKEKTGVSFMGRYQEFLETQSSLHAFETAFNIRTGIRTSKPTRHSTYLAQLIHDAEH